MPRVKKPYTREELFKLIGRPLLHEDEKRPEQTADLAIEAFKKDLITAEAFRDMNCCGATTVKRYLTTVVQDTKILQIVDRYVMHYSIIFAAGSITFNAFLAYCNSLGRFNDDQFIKDVLDQTMLKYILLPFKSELSMRPSTATAPLPDWAPFWQEFGPRLRPLYPTHEELKHISWDQPLGYMQARLSANFKTHVKFHFCERFNKYIMHRIKTDFELSEHKRTVNGTSRKVLTSADRRTTVVFLVKLCRLIESGKSQVEYADDAEILNSTLPEAIVAFVNEERLRVGLAEGKLLQNTATSPKLFPAMFRYHIAMSEYFEQTISNDPAAGLKMFSVAPVNKVKRTYATIDNRIIKDLVGESDFNGEIDLENVFGLSRAAWKKLSKMARKKKRKKGWQKKNKKKHCGMGKMPHAVVPVQSVTTDGVAIAVSVYTFPKQDKPDDGDGEERGAEAEAEEPDVCGSKAEEPAESHHHHTIGVDEGRVNLYLSAQKNSRGEWVATRLTARKYQKAAGIIKNREWEAQFRADNPRIAEAYAEMSRFTWKTASLQRLLDMVGVLLLYYTDIRQAHVVQTEHAKWRMALWRKKMSVMMSHIKHTVTCVDVPVGTKIVLAVGDGKFASVGKKGREKQRHGGVPTSWQDKMFVRTMKCLNRPFEYRPVDEYMSTQCCHKCEKVMTEVLKADGSVDRGLKCCPECSRRENIIKLRNRDLNAAQNMWKIMECELAGMPRPKYLERKKTRARRQISSL
jgi:hypothetical protein